jgi:hypothetical protein
MKENRYKTIIKRAIQVLQKFKWHQGGAYQRDGVPVYKMRNADSFCAIGALRKAQIELHYSNAEYLIAIDKLNRLCISNNIIYFNDANGVTKEQVIEKFNQVISQN